MIVRTWRAQAAQEKRSLYPEHFREEVLPKLRALPGFLGAYLLERDVDGEVELVVQTLWTSMEAVAGFAGARFDVAVVDPEARAMLLRHDECVSHHSALVTPDEGT